MRFENWIRRIFPGYQSKRELRMEVDMYRDTNKTLVAKVQAQEVRPYEVRARYVVSRKLYKEMCTTGRYSIMKHRVYKALAEQMVDELGPMLPVEMEPIDHPGTDGPAFEFTARMMFVCPPATGRDAFGTASVMSTE